MLSPVQWRVISNAEVHGIEYAIEQEAKRFMRKGGISLRVARIMAEQHVRNVLQDVEMEHVHIY